MTLTDFLLARIAEDEAEVSDWPIDGEWGLHSPGLMWVDPKGHPIYAPRARVLAECEAKRRIVDEVAWQRRTAASPDATLGEKFTHEFGEGILSLLALPYADHTDYRKEWRP